MKTILFIDTETTGLPEKNRLKRSSFYDPEMYDKYDNARMIEFACVLYKYNSSTKDLNYIKSFSTLICCNDEFEVKNTEIHGITTEMSKEFGEPIQDTLEYIHDNFIMKCDEIVGHNINFDINILLAEACRIIDSFKPNTRATSKKFNSIYEHIKNKKTFCTMTFFKDQFNWPKWPKLQEMYKALYPQTDWNQIHRALDDVQMTIECYKKIKPMVNE